MDFDLKQALAQAAPGAVIDVPPGAWAVTLVCTRPVTLRGAPGARLEGRGRGPLVRVDAPGAEVVLERLAFSGGVAQAGGAACLTAGRLVVRDCTFEDNGAPAYGGGAVYARGERLLVERCRFERNGGRQGGAVLLDELVEATLLDSLFVGNRARRGAALRVKEGATALASGCTFAGHAPPGPTLDLAPTRTRAPRLVLEDSLWAEAGAPEFPPGDFLARRCVLPPSLAPLGGESLFAVPRFAPGGWALRPDSPGATLARPAPGRRTLDGAPRGACVGALRPWEA